MSNQIKKAQEDTLKAIQRVVELLSNPEYQGRLLAVLADIDGELKQTTIEKKVVVIAPVSESNTDLDNQAEDLKHSPDDCIVCKINEFLNDHPEFASCFEELQDKHVNGDISDEEYENMLKEQLIVSKTKTALADSVYKQNHCSDNTSSEKSEVKPRKREEFERSVPWGRNNPSPLMSHISTTSDNNSVENEKPDADEVTVSRHDWLNLNVELIKHRSIIAALHEYCKGLEKQLEIESGIELDSFKFEL